MEDKETYGVELKKDNDDNKIYERKDVENSPFTLYKKGNGKWTIAISEQLCTPNEYNTTEEAEKEIMEKPWDLIVTTILIILEKSNNWKLKNEN